MAAPPLLPRVPCFGQAYARKVQEQLPPVSQPADPSLPPECNIDIAMQQRVCAVVNTCEYCHVRAARAGNPGSLRRRLARAARRASLPTCPRWGRLLAAGHERTNTVHGE